MASYRKLKIASEQSESVGEISIFIKTTQIEKASLSKLIRIFSENLLRELSLDPALIKVEEISEVIGTGTQRTLRLFYRVFKASDSKENSDESVK